MAARNLERMPRLPLELGAVLSNATYRSAMVIVLQSPEFLEVTPPQVPHSVRVRRGGRGSPTRTRIFA
jgi:hypothetical protein